MTTHATRIVAIGCIDANAKGAVEGVPAILVHKSIAAHISCPLAITMFVIVCNSNSTHSKSASISGSIVCD